MKYKFKKDWTVIINTSILYDIGIYEHLDILYVYQSLLLLADHKIGHKGEVFFTKTFAAEVFHMGSDRYRDVLKSLVENDYATIIQKGNAVNGGTKIKLLHYSKITSFKNK